MGPVLYTDSKLGNHRTLNKIYAIRKSISFFPCTDKENLFRKETEQRIESTDVSDREKEKNLPFLYWPWRTPMSYLPYYPEIQNANQNLQKKKSKK